MEPARDFEMREADFRRLRELVHRVAGIALTDAKRELVYARLSRRIRKLGLRGFAEYRALLEREDGGELEHFVNALTTNLTSFFREPAHFDHVRDVLVPRWRARAGVRRLRLWSAGCSSGQEAYSLAMVLAESLPDHEAWDWRILGTDLDSTMIDQARAGVYPLDAVTAVSPARLRRFFQRGRNGSSGHARVAPALKGRIAFRTLNLIGPWPMHGPFDAILCRNVVIYFDRATQDTLYRRFADLQAPGGTLFVGHSESLPRDAGLYRPVAQTTYERLP